MKRKGANHQPIRGNARNEGNEAPISRGEIRFVFPRVSQKDQYGKMVQFLFPTQQEPRSDDILLSRKRSKPNESPSPEQTADAVVAEKSRFKEGVGEKSLISQKKEEQKHRIDENRNRSLVRSVEDAVKDKVGRRPRANSTDCELNLPQHGLCDERIILLSHKWDMERLFKKNKSLHLKSPPPRGFANLGNTCFLNATLQCLVYMPSFCQTITALPDHCYKTNMEGGKIMHGQQITMSLRMLLRLALGIIATERNESPKTSPITPKAIHKAITCSKVNGHRFRPGRQEDAHELLVHLLDAMHEGELVAAGINPNESGWREKLPIPRLDETTFVHRIFGGYYRSQLKCNKCGYKSNTYDPFLDLALEVSKKHIDSLAAAFKEFTRKEKLDSKNSWKCSGCNKHVCPTKQLSVFRPPLSLCIHLKRFGFDVGGSHNHGGWGFGHRHSKGLSAMGNNGAKISKKIDFPAHLSLPLSDGRVCQYHLTGVIIHVGISATSGHYTSFVKHPEASKQWCHMDDSYVEMVSEKTVLKQRDAYVLFYTRKEVKLEFPLVPPPRVRVPPECDAKCLPKGSAASVEMQRDTCSVSGLPHSNVAALKLANGADSRSLPIRRDSADTKQSLSYKSIKKAREQTRQRRAWNPHGDSKHVSGDGHVLLNNIAIGSWNDNNSKAYAGGFIGKNSLELRSTAMCEMDSKARSKKKKMHIGYWDSLIDEAKQRKRK